MKSKKAKEEIEHYRSAFSITDSEAEETKHYCRLFTEIVEIAEADARERAVRAYCKRVCAPRGCGKNHKTCDHLGKFMNIYDNE